MIKSCENCKWDCDYDDSRFKDCGFEPKEKKMKEIDFICKHCGSESSIVCNKTGRENIYPISSDQIGFLVMKIKHSIESGLNWLKEMFPEEFKRKPMQDFCCDEFKALVLTEEVTRGRFLSEDWCIKTRIIKYCYCCGKKPIKPISGKE